VLRKTRKLDRGVYFACVLERHSQNKKAADKDYEIDRRMMLKLAVPNMLISWSGSLPGPRGYRA